MWSSRLLRVPSITLLLSRGSSKKKKTMLAPLELATGKEKRELLELMAGNCDPFHNNMVTKGPSTKDNPTKVPSSNDMRMVGCLCHGEFHSFCVSWMVLHKGVPKRCGCGYWFELCPVEPLWDKHC